MAYSGLTRMAARLRAFAAARYGLAFASVAIALGLTHAFLYFDLPQPFTAFALCAIALTFWFGGNRPGVLATLFSVIVRTFLFEPEVHLLSRVLYDFVFLMFAALMLEVTRARNELEARVAERTAELTRANSDLRLAIAEHTRTEEKLRQTEAYLAEAQRLSHTGSCAWDVTTKQIIHSSEEYRRICGFDAEGVVPPWEQRIARIHPQDRKRYVEITDTAIRDKTGYELDCRYILPSGDTRDIHIVQHPVLNPSGELIEFVGTVMDVTERRRADEERERFREAQADLARISRLTTLGELTASLAHEINQPITAALTDANTCLQWLTGERPDVEEAREAGRRVVTDVTRAVDIIGRIRLLFKKGTPQWEPVDVNEVARETIALLRGEAARQGIAMQTQLARDLPVIFGDRVQLQQVLMNLIVNSIDAMKGLDGPRELAITSRATDADVVISISDTGVGLPAQHADQIFNAFVTTKVHGTGMGLSISRSIVQSHGGRLWAADNAPRGASFHVTLPISVETHESVGTRFDGLHH